MFLTWTFDQIKTGTVQILGTKQYHRYHIRPKCIISCCKLGNDQASECRRSPTADSTHKRSRSSSWNLLHHLAQESAGHLHHVVQECAGSATEILILPNLFCPNHPTLRAVCYKNLFHISQASIAVWILPDTYILCMAPFMAKHCL